MEINDFSTIKMTRTSSEWNAICSELSFSFFYIFSVLSNDKKRIDTFDLHSSHFFSFQLEVKRRQWPLFSIEFVSCPQGSSRWYRQGFRPLVWFSQIPSPSACGGERNSDGSNGQRRGRIVDFETHRRINVLMCRRRINIYGIVRSSSFSLWFPIPLDWETFGDFLTWQQRTVEVRFIFPSPRPSSSDVFRCLSDSLFRSLLLNRRSSLFHGIGVGTIHQPRSRNRFQNGSRLARSVSTSTHCFVVIFRLGVGIAMIINSVLGTLYYNVIIAWALFYFILSFRSTLLWTKCGNWWNSKDQCFEPAAQGDFYRFNETKWNCTESQFSNFSEYACAPLNNSGRVTVTEEFY